MGESGCGKSTVARTLLRPVSYTHLDVYKRQILDRAELRRRFPSLRLGEAVAGASFGEQDGHVNPLRLLAALQTAFLRRGGQLRSRHAVSAIAGLPGGGVEVTAGALRARAPRLLIAAGLGSAALGAMAGLEVPLRPQRGQTVSYTHLDVYKRQACRSTSSSRPNSARCI